MRGKPQANEARLWLLGHVNYKGDDCLIWPFSRDAGVGRGRVLVGKRGWWAHRLMCILAHGEAPGRDYEASHNCGQGHAGCVNPRHLEWKTRSANLRDRRKHGTHGGGRGPRLSRLTLDQIAEIRTHQLTQWGYAAKFGVTLGCVQHWWRSTHIPKLLSDDPEKIARRKNRQNIMSH